MQIKGTNYRMTWSHKSPYTKENPQGTTTCYIHEYIKGDKTDPIVATGVAKQYLGKEEKILRVGPEASKILQSAGLRLKSSDEVVVIRKAVPRDRWTKEEGRRISMQYALEDGKIPRKEWNKFYQSYRNRIK